MHLEKNAKTSARFIILAFFIIGLTISIAIHLGMKNGIINHHALDDIKFLIYIPGILPFILFTVWQWKNAIHGGIYTFGINSDFIYQTVPEHEIIYKNFKIPITNFKTAKNVSSNVSSGHSSLYIIDCDDERYLVDNIHHSLSTSKINRLVKLPNKTVQENRSR